MGRLSDGALPTLDGPRSMQLLQLSLVLGLGDEGFLDLTPTLGQFWLHSGGWNSIGPMPQRSWTLLMGCIYQTGEESHAEGVTKIVG